MKAAALGALLAVNIAACSDGAVISSASRDHDVGSGAGGEWGASGGGDPNDAGNDPDPVLTDAERMALAALSPTTLPAPPPDVTNHLADDLGAAELGRKLFFDPGFSGVLWEGDNDGSSTSLGKLGDTGKVACAGCHRPSGAFADDRSLGHTVSLAAGWTTRRSPSLLDVGQTQLVMWDGRKDSLFAQVFGPTEAKNEMNSSRLFMAERAFAVYRTEYEALFGAMPALDDASRFPALTNATTGCQRVGLEPFICHGMPGDGAEFDGMTAADRDLVTTVVANLAKTIGAYERKLTCGPGRFDAWMHGDGKAMSGAEQRGAALFVGKGGCVGCHSGPFLSDQKFHNVGLHPETVAVVITDTDDPGAANGIPQAIADPLNSKGKWSDGDDGRLPASVGAELMGAFKTPMLRCVAKRPSFMHTGQLHLLAAVIDFFSRGGDKYGYPGTNELDALSLSAIEQSDLEAFLHTLDGPGPPPEWVQ